MGKMYWRSVRFAMILLLFSAGSSLAKNITIDQTNSIEGWLVYKDKAASGSVAVTTGPNSDQKALELKYDLSGGNWVAWVKKIPYGMEGLQALSFQFRGKGNYTLEIKVADAGGATFGIKIPGGTNVPRWQTIVIPIDQFNYLWGGTTKVLSPRNIRQFELAVSTDGDGGRGRIFVSNIQYSTVPLKAVLPTGRTVAKKKKVKGGMYHPLGPVAIESVNKWKKFSDRGANLELSLVEEQLAGERPLQASFTWGLREIPGKQEQTGNWVAFLKTIEMDLSEMRSLVFTYKSTGPVTNLEVKLKDQYNTTYGKTYRSRGSSSEWVTISVPRSDFKYLWGGDGSGKFDWSHVNILEFALARTNDPRDSGTFTIGNIHFESAVSQPRTVGKVAKPLVGQVKVVIDDFTDLNPTNRYFIIAGDDSSLTLDSSRIAFEADYSMRMRYNLQSTRPTGSWVEAQRRFTPPLDWTGVEAVKIWVKGDGSQNIFRFTLTDGDGQTWVYDNQEVLASTDWHLASMPIEAFTLCHDFYGKVKFGQQLKKQLHTIKQLGISIISQPDRGSLNQGEVNVETLYVVGKGINPATAVPLVEKPAVGIAVPLKNWNLGGTSNSVLEAIPITGTNLTQNVMFKLTGNFDKFSVLGEIRLDSTFGDDADGFRSQNGTISSPNMEVTLLEPIEGVNNIIVGNLWFNSSPHIFANNNLYGGWGFKGVLVEGWIDRLHHRTYFLKHSPDSYTLAGHYAMTVDNLNINLIGTYYNQQPFIASATKLEKDDKALLLDLTQRIILPDIFNMTVRILGGYDWYQKYWDASAQAEIDERLSGGYLEGELNFTELSNIFWPGFSLTGRYRYVDPNYKPTYRQDPSFWDVEYGDQRGYNLRLYQKVEGAFFAAEYEKINRLSELKDDYRERTILSLGYNDWSSLDITLSQEFCTRIYQYTDYRYLVDGEPANLNENRRETITTLYVAYHLSGTFIISEWLQFKKLLQFDLNEEYSEMFAITRLSYFPAPNLTFSLENKFSRYGREQDVPTIDTSDPYSIYEYTRLRVDLTF